jgi:hypothetical protein
VSVGLIMMGSTLEEIVNPRLRTHHLFDPRHMVALIAGVRPRAEAEGAME